jgi:hypothetical protein
MTSSDAVLGSQHGDQVAFGTFVPEAVRRPSFSQVTLLGSKGSPNPPQPIRVARPY